MTSRGPTVRWGAVVALVGASALASGVVVEAREEGGGAPPPSLEFYATRIAPWLEANCASCHRGGGAGMRLEGEEASPADRPLRRARDFAVVARLVDPEAPETSRLLLKLVPEAEGGLPHAGGSFTRVGEDLHDELLDFASGATLSNLPPEAVPGPDRRARPGERVVLDASLSFDRDDDPLAFAWTLLVRPPGSRASLDAPASARATFTVDVEGTYVGSLHVSDGKAWSAARRVVVEALALVGPSSADAVEPSGLADLEPGRLRATRRVYETVLGRPPTPPEALAAAALEPKALARALLRTLEAGRAWIEDLASTWSLVGDARPLGEGARLLPDRLAGDELTPGAAEAVLARDPAFLKAHPPGPALAAAVGALLLGRTPSGAERLAWASPASLEAVLSSREFAQAATARRWARWRGPTEVVPPSVSPGVSIHALGEAALALPASGGVVGRSRQAGDLAYVRALFADLFGRRPSTSEARALVAACAASPSPRAGRSVVAALLLDSGEVHVPLVADLADPGAWLADRFLRHLGRPPGATEAIAFRTALLDPSGGPAVVVRALLTTSEYLDR